MMKSPYCIIARHWPIVALLLAAGVRSAFAQEATKPAKLPIYQQQPFDQITLTEDAGGGTFKVHPLPLANRRVPAQPTPSSKLKVELFDPITKAEIAWREIAKIELFEQMVLAEADALVVAKKFDEAYDYFAFLHANYPEMPSLAKAKQSYLYRNAGLLFQEGELPQAVALLEELHGQAPQYNGLAAALASVTDRLMNEYVKEERYLAARNLLERTAKRRGAEDRTVASWRAKLQAAATGQMDRARKHLTAKEYRQARDSALAAMNIWPAINGAAELLAEVNALYPMVVVSAAQVEPNYGIAPRLHPTALRREQLTTRPLVRLHSYSTRGPEHRSAWGDVKLASDRGHADFQMRRDSEMTGYDIANYIAATNSPTGFVRSVAIDRVFSARIDFVGNTVSPLSLLAQVAPGENVRGGAYAMETTENEVRFVASNSMLREIVEVASVDPVDEIDALQRGQVDVIVRVAPALLPMLSDDDNIEVRSYAIPSIHLLVPNMQRPYPANRTFRRAIAYAIDRETILRQEILGGRPLAGCRTISGPFPAADNADDFWGYAYDTRIAPLPYEPSMGITLLRVAADEVARAAAKANRDAPELETIIIGHENDPLHRDATEAIVERLKRLGIASRALPLTDRDDAEKCDFVYAEVLMREPLVDVAKLLNQGDLTASSGYLALALRELTSATNWREASDQLHKIHATLHAEQTVIPLWQLTDHFAIRKDLTGVSTSPITLYQDVDAWRIGTQSP